LIVVIQLHDKRRMVAGWLSKLQHAIAGVPLLLSALPKLSDEGERPMALLELAIALAVLASFVKEIRADIRAGRHLAHGMEASHHGGIGWFDLAAGVLLIYEAFHGAHHKPGYLRPQFFSGVATLGLGIFHARIEAMQHRRRYLKLDETGLEIRVKFRRRSFLWEDLASIDTEGPFAVFHLKNGGRHKVRLNLLHNADAVRQAIGEHARAAGVRADLGAAR
jgi:hypothetical protein